MGCAYFGLVFVPKNSDTVGCVMCSLYPNMKKHELKEITDMQLKFGGCYALKAPANCGKIANFGNAGLDICQR